MREYGIPITVTQIDTVQAPCGISPLLIAPARRTSATIRSVLPVPSAGSFDTLPPRIRLLNRYNDNFDIPSDSAGIAPEFQCSQWVVTDSVRVTAPRLAA